MATENNPVNENGNELEKELTLDELKEIKKIAEEIKNELAQEFRAKFNELNLPEKSNINKRTIQVRRNLEEGERKCHPLQSFVQ